MWVKKNKTFLKRICGITEYPVKESISVPKKKDSSRR